MEWKQSGSAFMGKILSDNRGAEKAREGSLKLGSEEKRKRDLIVIV